MVVNYQNFLLVIVCSEEVQYQINNKQHGDDQVNDEFPYRFPVVRECQRQWHVYNHHKKSPSIKDD